MAGASPSVAPLGRGRAGLARLVGRDRELPRRRAGARAAVPQVGGGTIDLATLRGKPVWVNFMQTTCPPCIDEFPLMNGFAARYAEDGLVIVAVDIREDEGDVAAFASSSTRRSRSGWTATARPSGVGRVRAADPLLDRHEGIVRDGALGGIGADVMARGVQTILPGVWSRRVGAAGMPTAGQPPIAVAAWSMIP